MAIRVFVDFDGAVAKQDVAGAFFRRYGGPECHGLAVRRREEQRSAVECLRAEAHAAGVFDRYEAERFVREQEIDGTFGEFAGFCRSRNVELTILSDGLDWHVRQILDANGIHGFPVFANRATLAGEGEGVRLVLEFPYTDAECSQCACCRRNVMLTHSGDDDTIVFVGGEYADGCPARYADIIFARAGLQAFCQNGNISYHLYDTFGDVQPHVSGLLERKRLPVRVAAQHLRREAFARE